jgi:hypothetical protein
VARSTSAAWFVAVRRLLGLDPHRPVFPLVAVGDERGYVEDRRSEILGVLDIGNVTVAEAGAGIASGTRRTDVAGCVRSRHLAGVVLDLAAALVVAGLLIGH